MEHREDGESLLSVAHGSPPRNVLAGQRLRGRKSFPCLPTNARCHQQQGDASWQLRKHVGRNGESRRALRRRCSNSPTFRTFVRRFWPNWGALMSGAASVPLTFFAVYFSHVPFQFLFACLAAFSVVFACYKVWRDLVSASKRFDFGVTRLDCCLQGVH